MVVMAAVSATVSAGLNEAWIVTVPPTGTCTAVGLSTSATGSKTFTSMTALRLPKAGGSLPVIVASPVCPPVTLTCVLPVACTDAGIAATSGLEDVKVTVCVVDVPRLIVSGNFPPVGMLKRVGPMPVSSFSIVIGTVERTVKNVEVKLDRLTDSVNVSSGSGTVSPTIGIVIVFDVSLLKKTELNCDT